MENTLEFLLKSKGLTKTKFAEEIGVTRQTIIRITKGKAPSMGVGMKIAEYFGKDVNDIFFDPNVKRVAQKGIKKTA